jgi:hypothetical protein
MMGGHWRKSASDREAKLKYSTDAAFGKIFKINSYWYFYFLKYHTLGLQYCIITTLLYFTTVLHLLHLSALVCLPTGLLSFLSRTVSG